MEEKWKVIDFASNYQISNTGLVRNKTTSYILKGRETTNGYLQVCLKIDDKNKFMNKYIHRLVAQYWLENSNNKKEVNQEFIIECQLTQEEAKQLGLEQN